MKLEIRSIDERAYPYLENKLKQGNSLSQLLLSCVELRKGKVLTIAPASCQEEALYEFETGGKVFAFQRPRGVTIVQRNNLSEKVLDRFLYSYVEKNDKNCCLFEDTDWSKDSKWIDDEKQEYVTYSNELYYFHNHHATLNRVNLSRHKSEGYSMLAVLFKLDSRQHLTFAPFSEVTVNDLQLALNNIEAFVTNVYDRESYLIWHRNNDIPKFLKQEVDKLNYENEV